MKEIIFLVTTYSPDPNEFDTSKLLETISCLIKHVMKTKVDEIDSKIIWFANNPAILPFIKHFLTEAKIDNHVTLKVVEDNDDDFDAWQSDLRYEVEQNTPSSAIECLAPNTLDDLPILFYGLQATESDLIELLDESDWYQNYHNVLPSTHRETALTWLYFLQKNDNDVNYEFNERNVQEYLIEASALSLLLHVFESVIENSFLDFEAESVLDALPLFDKAYITLSLDEEDKRKVLDVLEESDDQLSYAIHEALRLVSIQYAGQALASIGTYLGSDAAIFYTLWSSIWPDDALLQTDRFSNVLDVYGNKRLKMKGYEYVRELDFSSVEFN